MGPVWSLVRAELRTRRAGLAGLALIVLIATTVLLTAASGARRTSTAVERFRDWSVAADALPQSISPDQGVQMASVIDGLPYVEASTTRLLVNGFPADSDQYASIPDFAIYSDPSGRYGVDIDRPMVLRGRMPDPGQPDEIVVDEHTAAELHRDVGDHLTLATWTQDDLDSLFESNTFPGFNGPQLDLVVVGVTRSPATLQGQTGRATLTALAGPRFLESHPDIGSWPPVIVTRLADGENDVPRLEDDLVTYGVTDPSAPAGIDTAASTYLDTTEQTVGALTTGLWIFVVVAGAAAAVTIAQAVSRQTSEAARSTEVARALGMSNAGRTSVSAVPAVLAGVVGVVLGSGASILLSPLFPTGLARRAEVHPGLRLDVGALLVGGLALVLAIAGWAAFSSWRAQRRARRIEAAGERPSLVAARLASWGVPSPIVTGVRHAFEGYGGLSVPLRSALAASAIAVTGIVGAGVVSSSVRDLVDTPPRWGWAWSSEPDVLGDESVVSELAHDDRVDGVALGAANQIAIDGTWVAAASIEPLKGDIQWVMADGRPPATATEVALGANTMRQLGVAIGDTIEASGAAPDDAGGDAADVPPVALTVVGSVVMSMETAPGDGAALTPDGLEATRRDAQSQNLLLRFPDGVDRAELEQELTADYDLAFPPFSAPTAPAEVRNLDQGRGVAVALAAFFGVLGIAGVFHALTVSTRVRRSDFAVLRAIGFRRAQVRGTVISQSLTIAVVGLAVGVPAGLVVGRAFWNRLVDDLGVLDWPSTPWALVTIVVPVTAVAAVGVAWLPGRRAARADTTLTLRGD